MTSERPYQCRQKHFTPPPEIFAEDGHISTPQKAAIIVAKCIKQKYNIKISRDTLKDITNVSTRSQNRILESKQVRTLHNRLDIGEDPRGKKKALIRRDIVIVKDFINNKNIK